MLTAEWAGQRLPEILLPHRGGLLAVLEAYFDESERVGGIFCVSGFVFEPAHAKKFDREWRELMRDVWPFRMADMVAGVDRFERLTQRQRDARLRAAVALINSRMSLGVTVSCRLSEVDRYAPRWIRGFGHAYTLCCHVCMMSIGNWVRERGRNDRVAYLFESGHKAQSEAHDFLLGASGEQLGQEEYRYHTHGFVRKVDSSHAQAADLFAWEWAKCYDETIELRKRPMRLSLLALLKRNPRKYRALHLTGVPLRRFMAEIDRMGRDQLRESKGL